MTHASPRRQALGAALAALALLLGSEVAAQSATASLSTLQANVGETVTYTVTLEGGRGRRVGPPLATGALELVSRSPILDATTTINGQTERQVAWAYRARRPGIGRIRPFRAEVAGTPVTTAPVTVTVQRGPPVTRPAPAPSSSGSRELFVRAEPSRRTAVVGQQVVVDYVMYFVPEIQPRQTAPIGAWDAAGAWREEMDVPATYPRPATIGGQPYEAVTVRRIALFPTRSGELELAPMEFTVDLMRTTRTPSSDPFAPFFAPFRQRFEDREVTAPAVSIDVRPLPDGAPASFGGAVGDFSLTTTVDKQRVRAGESVRVRVAVRGDGNVALLEPPDLEAPPGFDAYDPRDERETFRSSEPLRGVKTFTYTFVPQGGGTFDIPAAPFTYFDPTDGRYKTLQTDPIEVSVDGAPLADAAPVNPSNAPAALKATADWRRPPGESTWLWGVLGGGLALPVVAAGLLLGARAGRRRFAERPARQRRRSGRALRQRLAAARGLSGPRAYAEVEGVTRAAIAEHVGGPLRPGDRPEAGLDPTLRQRAARLFENLERGQFAPGLGPDVGGVVDEAEAIIAALDGAPRSA